MSFRGKIAIPIESKLNLFLNEHYRFSADIVECGGFIASINFILSIEVGMTDGVKAFQKRYKDYIGLSVFLPLVIRLPPFSRRPYHFTNEISKKTQSIFTKC